MSQVRLRCFLGLRNVYCRCITSFARAVFPLNVGAGNPPPQFELSVAKLGALPKLKKTLMSPPTSALPQHGQLYALDTDARDDENESTLSQQQASRDKLSVECWSRNLFAARNSYSTTEKKCLAAM